MPGEEKNVNKYRFVMVIRIKKHPLLSVRTVENNRARIFKKVHVKTTAGVAI
jgi:hypothetical protein